jgi:uncharacterized protein (DUF1501 family)
MKRRTFVKHAAHSLALPAIMSSFGFSNESEHNLKALLLQAAEAGKVMVLIYLQGGNDGLNTVIPLDQLSSLNKARPHVILPESKLLNLTSKIALHPSLSGFSKLYKEGKLNIIQSVGYPDQSFSHFRSTDIWMSGSSSSDLVTSGWAGRYLNDQNPNFPIGYPNTDNPDPLAIEIGYGASMIFQGPNALMTTVINDPANFYQLIDNTDEAVPDTIAGDKLSFIRLIAKQSQKYGGVLKSAASKVQTQKAYPKNNSLADQLKIVARLVAGGLSTSLYMVRLGGFDTHNSQVEDSDHTQGNHANLLTKLDGAVTAFMNDLKFLGVDDNVVGMTFSEFGRRIVSNASNGTDHGAAAPMFVFGNKVLSGITGNNPVIPTNANYTNNLEQQFDFRQIYSSVMQQWFGANPSKSNDLLFGSFDTMPIIADNLTTEVAKFDPIEPLSIYPNPIIELTTIDFLSTGNLANIEVVTMDGKQIGTIYSGVKKEGKQTIEWNASALSSGEYLIVYRSLNRQIAKHVVKI